MAVIEDLEFEGLEMYEFDDTVAAATTIFRFATSTAPLSMRSDDERFCSKRVSIAIPRIPKREDSVGKLVVGVHLNEAQ